MEQFHGYEALYNFYNIGATSSSEPMGAIINGLKYARDGKGASSETKAKYQIPWNTKERAITGGGIFIGSSYINIGQDTIYLQKFHVYDKNNKELFWHQYMTNVLAPYSESNIIYKGYLNSNLLNSEINFIIPIYNNMPNLPCKNPNIIESDFVSDNKKMYADVETTLNIMSGPGTSYETITRIDRNGKITRIEKGIQKGDLWDRVVLENGIVGYAFQSYLKEVSEVEIESINLYTEKTTINKNETAKINIEVIPKDANKEKITLTSSEPNIIKVDNEGNMFALKGGKASITATAPNKVSATIDIEVYSKVENMEIDIDKITLFENDSYNLVVTIYPEDASNKNVIFSSLNDDIAKVSKDGKITGIKEGKTEILVKSEDSKIEKQIEVTVRKKLDESQLKFDKNLTIKGNIISGFDYKNMTVENIKKYITTNYKIQFENYKEELLQDTALCGTGSKIKIIKEETNEVLAEYVILLYGDVTGDGKINSVDLLILQRDILEIEKLDEIFKKAGNIAKNGKKPTSVDLLLIQRHILELKEIEQ